MAKPIKQVVMKTTQENKLSMYETVIETLDIYTAQVATIPALATAKSDLVNKTLEIRNLNIIQEMSTKGKTQDKAQRKLGLADQAYAIAASTQAYATVIENNDLYQLINFTRSTLRTSDDEIIQQRCQLIHDQANTVIADLADYGVLPATLTTLQDLINAWGTNSQAPRQAIATRSAATGEIPTEFSEADTILKKRMDKLMANFYTTDRSFYDTYFKARKIVDLGHGPSTTTAIRGTVLDDGTSQPIQGAIITASDTELVATTNEFGEFTLEKTPLGTQQFVIQAELYNQLIQEEEIAEETPDLTFRLIRS